MNKDQHWKATTEHGTTYTYRGGSIFYDSERQGRYGIRPGGMRLVDRDELMTISREQGDDAAWSFIHNSPSADIPEVGKSLYIFNMSEWRLSTEVVKVELLEDENADPTLKD